MIMIKNFLNTHKVSTLSLILVIAAAVLGADSGFAMAVDVVEGVGAPEVQDGVSVREKAQPDEKGGNTQLQGKSTTATDARDGGLEAEDLDPDVVNFRPFRFPIESYIANRCQQVKSNSPVHAHYRSAATELEDYFCSGSTLEVGKVAFTAKTNQFANAGASLTECSTVFVRGVDGYDEEGNVNGDLELFVLSNDDETIKFIAVNPKKTGTIEISHAEGDVTFSVAATACSESQMRVAPESYLPEKYEVFLQKKNANVIITDEWREQAKKVKWIVRDVLQNGLYNYKRKCARSHWLGVKKRLDVKVKELNGNVEAVYFEEGILRQIPMLHAYGDKLTWDDLFAVSMLQFTNNSANNKAVAFCGKNMITKIMKLAKGEDGATQRDIFENAETMGISVKRWKDIFGEIEFVHDPTLDDIGYADYMAVIDIDNAVRYYKRNEQQTTQDMKKTGESREAERTIISTIDCIALKGYNAVLVCPSDKLADAMALGGVSTIVEVAPASAVSTSDLDTHKMYYLGKAIGSFNAGSIIKYDTGTTTWVEVSGEVVA